LKQFEVSCLIDSEFFELASNDHVGYDSVAANWKHNRWTLSQAAASLGGNVPFLSIINNYYQTILSNHVIFPSSLGVL
jgi:hypothetical protein